MTIVNLVDDLVMTFSAASKANSFNREYIQLTADEIANDVKYT